MNWSVIKFSGKQYFVKPGTKIQVDDLGQEVGETIKFDQVLLVGNDKVLIGKPVVGNCQVTGKIVRKFASKKIVVTKFKPKSRYLRRIGSRKKLSEIAIEKILVKP